MLKLTVVLSEELDEETNEFIVESVDIELEHSLASLSKWEEIWEIPLLATNDKSDDQEISYLQCMCLTPDVSPEVFRKLTNSQRSEISDYIEKSHTATWFSKELPSPKSGEVLTAELIYYWLSGFQIDWQAQYWNLNRLLTLIRVHSVKQDNTPKKQSARSRQNDIAKENARRRQALGSNG